MNRALVLSALSLSFLVAAPLLQGCSSAADESTSDSSSDDLKKACTGPLPQSCKVCDDGSDGCAHWVRHHRKCEIQYCKDGSDKVCSGPLPQSCKVCDDGSTGCAHWVNDGGKCEIQYCAPSTENECNTASDCKGALPQSCQVCADGSNGCAHHECTDHKCTIGYCDAPPPPPAGNECTKDSDCKGMLPMSCILCSDGSDGCAHHKCTDGTCGISYCD